VRVFIADVKEQRALDAFVDRLAKDVAAQGGVVDRFQQEGLTLIRFLQPIKGDKGQDLASLSYALIAPDRRAVHLITSIVAFDAQKDADANVRGLLAHAAWTTR